MRLVSPTLDARPVNLLHIAAAGIFSFGYHYDWGGSVTGGSLTGVGFSMGGGASWGIGGSGKSGGNGVGPSGSGRTEGMASETFQSASREDGCKWVAAMDVMRVIMWTPWVVGIEISTWCVVKIFGGEIC